MTNTALADLAARLADVQARKTALVEQEAAIKTSIKALVGEPGTYDAGDLKVTVSQSGRLDTKAIEAKWTIDERPELYDTAPHVTVEKAREHIAPADLEAFTKYTAPSVTVR